MSGGFFRGTSAEQDTRFSNKQAKLLKSQKFAPELDHLVDMTKVKMDVMRPWIANRVTELIGFEDEVLINFIYGLLDGKEVNGKEVQISLTGFMERNTGKFMKELWALLLSAQKNASGVPQQFLDAKEEETKKKKAESDRIADNIQRKKEKESRELEQERNKKTDAGNDIIKGIDAGRELGSKHLPTAPRESLAAEKEPKERNGSRVRSMFSKSSHSDDHSSSPRRLRSRSVSKSFSSSRSRSNERGRSRSLSASPKRRERSSSSGMVRRPSPKRSRTPHLRHSPRHSLTPPRRRSFYSRRHASPSPNHYSRRSPRRRRSRSPLGRRSRSPIRRRSRSPIRRSLARSRSRSPVRPFMRRRSPSLSRRRSPSLSRRRSPSPIRDRSPSSVKRRYRGSPLSPQFRSRSPVWRRSPLRSKRRSPSLTNRRSPSPQNWSSRSPVHRRSPLPIRRRSPKRLRSPVESPRRRKRDLEQDSPARHASPRAGVLRRSKSLERRSRSGSWDRDGTSRKMKASSPSRGGSSPISEDERRMSGKGDIRSSGPPHSPVSKSNIKITNSYSPSPLRKSRDYRPRHDSSERSADNKYTNDLRDDDKLKYKSSRDISKNSNQHKDSHVKDDADDLSPQRIGGHRPVHAQSRGELDANKKAEVSHGSGRMDQLKKSDLVEPQNIGDRLSSRKERNSPVGEGSIYVEKNQSSRNDIKANDGHLDSLPKLSKKAKQKDRSSSEGSGSEESDMKQYKVREKRKKKRSERHGSESEDETSYDSYEEERKEAKRRRKEEKRSKKEEKRRRREERRRKKEERRSGKLKLKSLDAVSSASDAERHRDGHSDDDQHVRRRESRRGKVEETATEQKKLEIELREKALENLRAKKGVGH